MFSAAGSKHVVLEGDFGSHLRRDFRRIHEQHTDRFTPHAVSDRRSAPVAVVVSLLIALSTLAFGAVYAWVYLPLFIAAACIGVGAIVHRRGIARELHHLSLAGLIVALAIGVQLLPLNRRAVMFISPQTPSLLARYVIGGANADRQALSLNPAATARGLGVVVVLGVYTLGLAGILSRRRVRVLVQGLVVFATPLALVGMYGREHSNGLVLGFWQPVESVIADSFGPFVNRNHFAGWMLIAAALTMGRLCGQAECAVKRLPPDARRRFVWLSSAEVSMVAIYGMALLVMSTSLIWTMSRSGILSLGVAMACFAWLILRRHSVDRALRVAGIGFLGLVLLAGLRWRGFERLIAWFGDSRDVVGRLGAWQDGWLVIRDFPVAGTGINTYRIAMLFYQRHSMAMWMSHAHNDYLQLVAEGGLLVSIPVAAAAVVFCMTVLRNARRHRSDSEGYWIRAGAAVGLVAIAFQEIAEFSLHIPANMFLFATAAAIALSPALRPARTTSPLQ